MALSNIPITKYYLQNTKKPNIKKDTYGGLKWRKNRNQSTVKIEKYWKFYFWKLYKLKIINSKPFRDFPF